MASVVSIQNKKPCYLGAEHCMNNPYVLHGAVVCDTLHMLTTAGRAKGGGNAKKAAKSKAKAYEAEEKNKQLNNNFQSLLQKTQIIEKLYEQVKTWEKTLGDGILKEFVDTYNELQNLLKYITISVYEKGRDANDKIEYIGKEQYNEMAESTKETFKQIEKTKKNFYKNLVDKQSYHKFADEKRKEIKKFRENHKEYSEKTSWKNFVKAVKEADEKDQEQRQTEWKNLFDAEVAKKRMEQEIIERERVRLENMEQELKNKVAEEDAQVKALYEEMIETDEEQEKQFNRDKKEKEIDDLVRQTVENEEKIRLFEEEESKLNNGLSLQFPDPVELAHAQSYAIMCENLADYAKHHIYRALEKAICVSSMHEPLKRLSCCGVSLVMNEGFPCTLDKISHQIIRSFLHLHDANILPVMWGYWQLHLNVAGHHNWLNPIPTITEEEAFNILRLSIKNEVEHYEGFSEFWDIALLKEILFDNFQFEKSAKQIVYGLHIGLKSLKENILLIEWTADWKNQLKLFKSERGLIQFLSTTNHIESILPHDRFDASVTFPDDGGLTPSEFYNKPLQKEKWVDMIDDDISDDDEEQQGRGGAASGDQNSSFMKIVWDKIRDKEYKWENLIFWPILKDQVNSRGRAPLKNKFANDIDLIDRIYNTKENKTRKFEADKSLIEKWWKIFQEKYGGCNNSSTYIWEFDNKEDQSYKEKANNRKMRYAEKMVRFASQYTKFALQHPFLKKQPELDPEMKKRVHDLKQIVDYWDEESEKSVPVFKFQKEAIELLDSIHNERKNMYDIVQIDKIRKKRIIYDQLKDFNIDNKISMVKRNANETKKYADINGVVMKEVSAAAESEKLRRIYIKQSQVHDRSVPSATTDVMKSSSYGKRAVYNSVGLEGYSRKGTKKSNYALQQSSAEGKSSGNRGGWNANRGRAVTQNDIIRARTNRSPCQVCGDTKCRKGSYCVKFDKNNEDHVFQDKRARMMERFWKGEEARIKREKQATSGRDYSSRRSKDAYMNEEGDVKEGDDKEGNSSVDGMSEEDYEDSDDDNSFSRASFPPCLKMARDSYSVLGITIPQKFQVLFPSSDMEFNRNTIIRRPVLDSKLLSGSWDAEYNPYIVL